MCLLDQITLVCLPRVIFFLNLCQLACFALNVTHYFLRYLARNFQGQQTAAYAHITAMQEEPDRSQYTPSASDRLAFCLGDCFAWLTRYTFHLCSPMCWGFLCP